MISDMMKPEKGEEESEEVEKKTLSVEVRQYYPAFGHNLHPVSQDWHKACFLNLAFQNLLKSFSLFNRFNMKTL